MRDLLNVKNIFASIAVFAILYSAQVAAGDLARPPATSTSSTMDSLIKQQMSEVGIMGLAAAIIVDKEVVWMKGYGFADQQREGRSPQTRS